MASLAEKPPLLFIHGMWSTPHVWSHLRAHFHAVGHATLAPALPLHDVDPALPPDPKLGTLGLGDYVEAVVTAAAALPQTPIVIGHSMGGLLAQLVAQRLQPKGLVLLSPAGSATTVRPSIAALRTVSGIMLGGKWWQRPTRIEADKARWGVFNNVPPQIAEAEIDSLVWDSGRALLQIGLPWADKSRASTVDYGRLAMPALVVVGEEDRTTPVAIARATARALRNVDYRELPGVGHWLFHAPVIDEVTATIEAFVARL